MDSLFFIIRFLPNFDFFAPNGDVHYLASVTMTIATLVELTIAGPNLREFLCKRFQYALDTRLIYEEDLRRCYTFAN